MKPQTDTDKHKTLMSGCFQPKSVELVNTAVIKPTPTPTPTATADPNKIINIPNLTRKTPNDLQGIMPGSATDIRASSDLEYHPSEDRVYALPNTPGGELTVTFYKEKPVKFFMKLPLSRQAKTPEELAKLAGIDVGKGKQISPILTVRE